MTALFSFARHGRQPHTHTHAILSKRWKDEQSKEEKQEKELLKKRVLLQLQRCGVISTPTRLHYILHSQSILLWELAEWSHVAYSWGQPPWDPKCIKKLMFTLGSFQKKPRLNLWPCLCIYVCVCVKMEVQMESGGWALRSVIDRPPLFSIPPHTLGAFCWPKTTGP